MLPVFVIMYVIGGPILKISFGTKHGAEARRENGEVAGHSKYAT